MKREAFINLIKYYPNDKIIVLEIKGSYVWNDGVYMGGFENCEA
jgi:hypothetical protein